MFLNILRFIWAWNSSVTGVEQDYLTMKFITRTEKKNCQVTFEWMSLLGGCQNNFKTGLKFPFFHQSCPNICTSSPKKPILPDRLCHFRPFSNGIHWSALLQSKLHLWRMRRRGCMAWGGGLCAFKERGGSGQINTSQGTAPSPSSVFLTEENIEICKLSEFWQQVVNSRWCVVSLDESSRLHSWV